MMDVRKYIDSGNLEQYCLELSHPLLGKEINALSSAYPEVKQELAEIEDAIARLALANAVVPDARLRARVLNALDFVEDERLDLDHLPPTGKYSSYTQWLNAVEHLIPEAPFEDFFMEVLQQNEQIAQTLIITKLDVPEEVHEHELESFFILKGQCACTVGSDIFMLAPGDYLEIPLHVPHDIKLLSPYVIGILQHRFA